VLKARGGLCHPGYMDWWRDMGPEGFQPQVPQLGVYLRTAYSVDPRGLGQRRLCQDAGGSLGHLAGAAGRETA